MPSVSTIDLGTIPQGGSREAMFWLTNPGDAAVEINDVETSCPCVEIQPRKNLLRPKEKTPALVLFHADGSHDFTGRLQARASATTKDGDNLFVVMINIEVAERHTHVRRLAAENGTAN